MKVYLEITTRLLGLVWNELVERLGGAVALWLRLLAWVAQSEGAFAAAAAGSLALVLVLWLLLLSVSVIRIGSTR